MDTDPRSPVVLAPHFEFLPIDSSQGQVRILNIAPGKPGDIIKCSYEVVNVDDDDAAYETLSYVWGVMDGNRTAIIDGTKADLTDNLFAALTRIRHESETRRLWIDALCINQQDAAEKMAQVNMMRKIYFRCQQCNIWMGDIDYAAIGAAEPEALQAAKGALDAVRILAGEDFETPSPHLATTDQQAQAGKALKALMYTAWWGRIWTVQEATAPRNAIVHWGPLSIPWDVMKQAAVELIQGNYLFDLDHLFEYGAYGFFTAPILGLIWASEWVVDPEPPMDMLYRFRYRDSTDPRDKVYVILNLVAEGTYPLPSVTSSDYAINTAVLYRNVMLDLLRDEWGLRPMIGFRGERKSVPGLPSWVVDWSLPPPRLGIAKFWEHSNFWMSFTADRGLPMLDLDELTSPALGEDVLNLNGVYFDRVLARSDLIAEGEGDDRLDEIVDSLIKTALAEESRDRSKFEVYWQESLAGIVTGEHANPAQIFEGQAADEYWQSQMLQNQRLFIAENGAVGLGPSGTSVGDEIWVLAGCRTPFLLGPLHVSDGDGEDDKNQNQNGSGHYTFRGDAFVPKIMRGEAVRGKVDRQRFVHIH
ncbi:HET-domain-containing protein [Nemania sp. NC0429]|nr:HET-domain-containing protein [Nemania sp. NC0429]